MKNIFLLVFSFLLTYCSTTSRTSERELLQQKYEAFQFLSTYHHQLHIMIGEEEGDIKKAYDEFYAAAFSSDNLELLPVKKAILSLYEIGLLFFIVLSIISSIILIFGAFLRIFKVLRRKTKKVSYK